MSRQDQASITLFVDGIQSPIKISKRSGGGKDSEETKYPPGGNEPEESLGGRTTVENVELVGLYKPQLHATEYKRLEAAVDRDAPARVVEKVIDSAGNVIAEPEVWTGIMKAINRGEYDSTSDDAREVTIEISTHGVKS